MNKIYFCFLLSVLVCLHNYATGMIVLFVYLIFIYPKEEKKAKEIKENKEDK